MKIVHLAPSAPYNDHWGYQENLLPKYQQKLGHNVTLIITNKSFDEGKIVRVDTTRYVLNDGVQVIRLKNTEFSKLNFLRRRLDTRLDVYELLKEIKPDFIFHHGLISSTIHDAVKYTKKINPNCIIVQDNHLDFNIGFSRKSKKGKIANWYYRKLNKKSLPYVSKVYGVTPWRVVYAQENYNVPKDKLDVLIMGADDEKINFAQKEQIRKEIREKYNVGDSDFLIVTGGKIDKKKNIHILMSACRNVENVKLIVFGNVLDDIKEEFDEALKDNPNVIFAGWISSDDTYNYFLSSDLAFFPGQHSVLWEQACACKIPCVFMEWEGMDHVNNGGNSDFVFPVTEKTIEAKIEELKFTAKYYEMKKIAQSEKTDVYLYSNIAKKSLECAEK